MGWPEIYKIALMNCKTQFKNKTNYHFNYTQWPWVSSQNWLTLRRLQNFKYTLRSNNWKTTDAAYLIFSTLCCLSIMNSNILDLHGNLVNQRFLNHPWFLKYLQKFALGQPLNLSLSDNEYYLSGIYFWWHWCWFVMLVNRETKYKCVFPIYSVSSWRWVGYLYPWPKNSYYGNISQESFVTTICIARVFINVLEAVSHKRFPSVI